MTLLVIAGCGRTSLSLYEDGGDDTWEGGTNEAGLDAGDAGDASDLDASDGGPEGGLDAGDAGDGGLCGLCDDGIPCTDDGCDPASRECIFVPNSARCAAGEICVRDVGCQVVPCRADEVCADGFFCNGAERCQNGICVGGRPVECASSQCQVNRCDEATRNCVGTWRDDDDDGHSPLSCMGDDCDDNNRQVFPGARENCADGRDNDCNTRVDCDDDRCANATACNPPPPTETNCRNGVDDDGDGRIDCVDDDCFNRPVCQMPMMEVCTDGRDNDGDGAVDCADSDCFNDPACATDLCDGQDPREVARAACEARFPNCVDTGTTSFIGFASSSSQGSNCEQDPNLWLQFCYADGPDGFNCNTCQMGAIKQAHNPCTCGENTRTIEDFCEQTTTCPNLNLGSGQERVTGVTTGRPNERRPSCVPGSNAPEVTHRWVAPSTGRWMFTTEGSDFDATLYVLSGGCSGPELGCDDDGGSGFQARVIVSLTAGQSVITVVDGYNRASGNYALNIGQVAMSEVGLCGDGVDNDMDVSTDCGDPDCRLDPQCAMNNEVGRCGDGIDNDSDVVADCDDADCFTDPLCVTTTEQGQCGDGVDNDFDGLTDCADSDCFSDPRCQMQPEVCDDGRDNDRDNAIDCDDSDCFNDPDCVTGLCSDLPNPREAARAACAARFGSSCVDTGSASFIGFASPSTQGSNCDVGANRWLQFCYADAYDTYNCNTCQIGAIKLAHQPCTCGENTETFGDFCDQQPAFEQGHCGDGIDNDGDGAFDCLDPDCANDPVCVMTPDCPAFDLGTRVGSGVARGSTVGGRNDIAPFCVFSNAPEVTYRWRAPRAGTWQIDTATSTFDTALYVVRGGACDGDQIACDDDGLGRQSIVTVTLARNEEVVIVVDGWSSSAGNYVLNITSVITNERGQCADRVDNDNDNATDCADTDCLADPVCLASTCPDAELGSEVGEPVIGGSTLGQGNDFVPSCLGSSSSAPDVSYHWRAPRAGRWVFDTNGSQFDTALSVLSGNCDGSTLACNDDAGGDRDSSVTVTLTRGQEVVIVVDGWSSSAGNYALNIGRLVTNERGQCADFIDNDADGVRDCADMDCAGDLSCMQMCEPSESGVAACTDGRDNDCDMQPDCADPDCNAVVGGECCNGADDNGDGLVDVLACACQTSNDCGPFDSPIGVIPGTCWPSLGACGPDCSSFGVQAGDAVCRFINPVLRCQRSTGQCVISPQP